MLHIVIYMKYAQNENKAKLPGKDHFLRCTSTKIQLISYFTSQHTATDEAMVVGSYFHKALRDLYFTQA